MKKFSLFAIPALFASSFAFAQEQTAPARDSGLLQTLIMIGVALVFFYFILWRPEQKRRKSMDQKRNQMKKGDKITAMGIIGTIEKVQDDTVIVKMYDGAKLEFLKAAITDVQAKTDTVQATVES